MKTIIILTLALFTSISNAQMILQGRSNPLDLGEVNVETGISNLALIFKNTGSVLGSVSSALSGPNAADFKVTLSRCASVAPGKTCQINITSQRTISVGLKSFSIGGVSISMNIVKKDAQGNDVSNPAVVENLEITPATLAPIQFLAGEKTKSVAVNVKNVGNTAVIPALSWLANAANVKFSVNRCNTSLAVGKTCSLTLSIPAPSQGIEFTQSLQALVGSSLKDSLSFVIKGPAAALNVTLTNVVISPDGKTLTISGSGLSAVTQVKFLNIADDSEIDSMTIESKTNSEIIAKPSKNFSLPEGDVKLRLL